MEKQSTEEEQTTQPAFINRIEQENQNEGIEEEGDKTNNLNSLTNEEMDELIRQKEEKLEQRTQQMQAMRQMVKEQEQELHLVQQKGEAISAEYREAKTQYDHSKKTLEMHLRTKEDLFLKLQKLQAEIDELS